MYANQSFENTLISLAGSTRLVYKNLGGLAVVSTKSCGFFIRLLKSLNFFIEQKNILN